MLCDMAANWLDGVGIGPPWRDWILQQIDQANAGGNNCSFRIGASISQGGRPYLIHCFEDEFYVFIVDEALAEQSGVSTENVVYFPGSKRTTPQSRLRPPVTRGQPEILTGIGSAGHLEITGRVPYQMPYNNMAPYALRLAYDLPECQAVQLWQHFDEPLFPAGAIHYRFDLSAVGGTAGYSGLLPLFFSLWVVPNATTMAGIRPLSDTRGVLMKALRRCP